MFGFFRKSDPNRDASHTEMKQSAALLRSIDPLARIAVGHSINMAHSIFIKRFATVVKFQQLSKAEKVAYVKNLTVMVEKLIQQDPHSALGFRLFTLWLVGLIAEDTWLESEAQRVMAELSREGDLGG